MSVGQKRYRAFISYSQRDKAHARRIHKALENYRVPKGIDAPGIDPKTRRIGRFFRDDDEMGAASDLGEALRGAIADSENLIVICSPNSAKSKWVNEEVLHFKRTGRADRVFAVIAGGEPNVSGDEPCVTAKTECYPPALRRALGPNGEADGPPTEPFGLDIRKNKPVRFTARLAAALLDLPFDTIWRREQRRRRKKIISSLTTAAVLSVAIGLAGLFVVGQVQTSSDRAILKERIALVIDASEAAAHTNIPFDRRDEAIEAARTERYRAAALTYVLHRQSPKDAAPYLDRLGYWIAFEGGETVQSDLYGPLAKIHPDPDVDAVLLLPREQPAYLDLASDQLRVLSGLGAPLSTPTSGVLSPDRKWALSRPSDREIIAWDVTSKSLTWRREPVELGLWGPPSIAFHPDGGTVAIAECCEVEIRNSNSGEIVDRLPIPYPPREFGVPDVSSLTFSASGNLLHLSLSETGFLTYDFETLNWSDTIPVRPEFHDDLRTLDEGVVLFAPFYFSSRETYSGNVPLLKAYDTQSGDAILRIDPWWCVHGEPIEKDDDCQPDIFDSRPGQSHVIINKISTHGWGFRVFDARRPDMVLTPEVPNCESPDIGHDTCAFASAVLLGNGTQVAFGGYDGLIRVYDLESGELERTIALTTSDPVYRLQRAGEDRLLAIAGTQHGSLYSVDTVRGEVVSENIGFTSVGTMLTAFDDGDVIIDPPSWNSPLRVLRRFSAITSQDGHARICDAALSEKLVIDPRDLDMVPDSFARSPRVCDHPPR